MALLSGTVLALAAAGCGDQSSVVSGGSSAYQTGEAAGGSAATAETGTVHLVFSLGDSAITQPSRSTGAAVGGLVLPVPTESGVHGRAIPAYGNNPTAWGAYVWLTSTDTGYDYTEYVDLTGLSETDVLFTDVPAGTGYAVQVMLDGLYGYNDGAYTDPFEVLVGDNYVDLWVVDWYEYSDADGTANGWWWYSYLDLDEPQAHSFEASMTGPVPDADYLLFDANPAYEYTIETFGLGPDADKGDTYLNLLGRDVDDQFTVVLASDNDGGDEPGASKIIFAPPSADTYLIQVTQTDNETGGWYQIQSTATVLAPANVFVGIH